MKYDFVSGLVVALVIVFASVVVTGAFVFRPRLSSPPCADVSPHVQVAAEVVAPYVEISDDALFGSGVYVGDNLIVTARHVVFGKPDVPRAVGTPRFVNVVKKAAGDTVKTTQRGLVLDGPRGTDIAFVMVRPGNGLTIANQSPGVAMRHGETCYYIGTPHGQHAMLERAIVGKGKLFDTGVAHFAVGGLGDYGNSGGPAFVLRGGRYVLAGICSYFLNYPSPRSPLAFVHADVVYPAIADAKLNARRYPFTGEWK